jgi:Tol biopolymer transport system component
MRRSCRGALVVAMVAAALAGASLPVAAATAPITGFTRVSFDDANRLHYDAGFAPAISGNGRFVAFTARPFIAGDPNVDDVYVRDLVTGDLTLVSEAVGGGRANGQSTEPAISASGRWVAFTSTATNLIADDHNGVSDVFVRDLKYGITRRVSVTSSNDELTRPSMNPDISADGNLVAFVVIESSAWRIAVRNRHRHTTAIYASGPATCESGEFPVANFPTLGANGRYLAFTIFCSAGQLFTTRVVERDRSLGTWKVIASVPSSAEHALGFSNTRYSADGNALAWVSQETIGIEVAYSLSVRERTPRYLTSDFTQTGVDYGRPDLSADGRYLLYVGGHGTEDDGTTFGQVVGPLEAHVVDRATNFVADATAPPGRTQRAAGDTFLDAPVSIDDAGDLVAFSTSERYLADDNNHGADVYVTTRASAPASIVPEIIVNTQFGVREPGFAFNTALAAHYSGPNIPITWSTVDNTARAPGDFDAVTDAPASVPPNINAGTAPLTVTVHQDTIDEPTETFWIRVRAPRGFRVIYHSGAIKILDG